MSILIRAVAATVANLSLLAYAGRIGLFDTLASALTVPSLAAYASVAVSTVWVVRPAWFR